MEYYDIKLNDANKTIKARDWTWEEDVKFSKKIDPHRQLKLRQNNRNKQILLTYREFKDQKITEDEYKVKTKFIDDNYPYEEIDQFKEIELTLDFIQTLVHEDSIKIFNKLSMVDIYYLFFMLRNNSKGSEIRYTYKCNNKKAEIKDKIKQCPLFDVEQDGLIDIVKDINYNYRTTKEIVLDKNFIIKTKILSFKKQLNIIKDLKPIVEGEEASASDLQYNLTLSCIEDIIEDGQPKNFSSTEELNKYINQMKPKYVNKILAESKNLIGDISIERKNICFKCRKEYPMRIEDFNFFF